MTNEQPTLTDGPAPDQPLDTLTFAVPALDYSQARVAISDNREWWLWFWTCIKVAGETKAEVFGVPLVEEAEAAGATPDMPPRTAYTNPQGEFVNPDPPPGAPPVQQPPPAAPQRPQGGQQQQGGQGERQAPEWQSWPVMPDWLCDLDPSHEVRERPAAGNAGRRAICHVCKDELTGGRSAHHVVTGGWLDN